MKNIRTINNFLNELAVYCSKRHIENGYNMLQAADMLAIAATYECQAELLYLLQFNYEDCTNAKEWLLTLAVNLNS